MEGQNRNWLHFTASEDVTLPVRKEEGGESIAGELRLQPKMSMLITPPHIGRLSNGTLPVINLYVGAQVQVHFIQPLLFPQQLEKYNLSELMKKKRKRHRDHFFQEKCGNNKQSIH